MTIYQNAPPVLLNVCHRWSAAVAKLRSDDERIRYFESELVELLGKRSLFARIMENIAVGKTYPDIRQARLFENEIILYLNPKRLFSLRMYIYDADEFSYIHDHSSWGVTGALTGTLQVKQYVRQDDGSKDGYARLGSNGAVVYQPGQIETTLPLDDGIHQTGNPGPSPLVMISVYGKPLRRLYIHRFEPESHKVVKVYPPKIRKKMLVLEALKHFV